MTHAPESLPADLAAAHAMILAERAARLAAEADRSSGAALIAHLKLQIAKLRRELYGTRSERTARLLDQMELELEELEAAATEQAAAAETALAQTSDAGVRQRRAPSRKPFPTHLPRERVVIPAPEHCPCCGSAKLSKLGEDITETLEVVPRSWKVIQTVRERFACRTCESIAQPPAPFHVTPRGFAGPNLLAMILFEKFGQHQPLNRQSERFAREGIEFSVSILARGKTVTGRIWTYVRDDRPFGGPDPPAALFHASRDRAGHHPEAHLSGYIGILQADAYSGYNRLYDPARLPGPVTSALCWAHARRGFFVLADVAANTRRGKTAAVISPIALEAVRRIDVLFEIERGINGRPADERLRVRRAESAPLVAELETWLREQCARLSRSATVAEPIDYLLRRWPAFTRFLDDGRVCLSNNAAERALRGFALGRKAWLFAGSDRGAERAAVIASLITTAKLNNVDPQAWLADVLARIADHPARDLDALLPWNWRQQSGDQTVAEAA